MNGVLLLLQLLAILLLVFGFVFTAIRWRAAQRQQARGHPRRRFQQRRITGIHPLILRASRPRRAAHPPVVQVLPQAIAPPPTPEEHQAMQKQAASQTTVSAFPVSHPLKLSSCPRCAKPIAVRDVFCGSCGMRLHRSAQSHN